MMVRPALGAVASLRLRLPTNSHGPRNDTVGATTMAVGDKSAGFAVRTGP
jgi:hypothetical protein